MKKLVLIFAIVLVSLASMAQRTITATLDTIETVSFTAMQDVSAFSVICTQLGGTSDGSLVLQGSADGNNYTTVSETAGWLHFWPNDTLKITDAATWLVGIDKERCPFNYFRVQGKGTASDTTIVTVNWVK